MKSIKKILFLSLIFCLVWMSIQFQPALATRSYGQRGYPFEVIRGTQVYYGIQFDHILDLGDGVELQIQTSYSSVLNTSTWKITGNKHLLIDLEIKDQPADLLVWIEHMHADCFVESKYAEFDEKFVDSMDDKFHGDYSPGFYINETYSYAETFSIEGSSADFQVFWDGWWRQYEDVKSLNEDQIRSEGGVYANSFFIVYDVAFRYDTDPNYLLRKVDLADSFMFDVEDGFVDNAFDKADIDATNKPTDWFKKAIPGFELPVAIGGLLIIAISIVFWRKRR